MELLFAIAIGYLLGSIPFALVIGKVFFKRTSGIMAAKILEEEMQGECSGKRQDLLLWHWIC